MATGESWTSDVNPIGLDRRFSRISPTEKVYTCGIFHRVKKLRFSANLQKSGRPEYSLWNCIALKKLPRTDHFLIWMKYAWEFKKLIHQCTSSFINILHIIIMCQFCCRHWRSWPSIPLCHQFFWWAHCWGILSSLLSYSDCQCILCIVFHWFWYHKSFHTMFAFLIHHISFVYMPKKL